MAFDHARAHQATRSRRPTCLEMGHYYPMLPFLAICWGVRTWLQLCSIALVGRLATQKR